MNTTKRTTEVPVKFEVQYEVHDKKKFQAEGHFVPAVRERDAHGEPTMQPRKWKGTQVHALTLSGPNGCQTLRALSDSREESERILGEQIRRNFWGTQKAIQIVEFNAEQARRVKDERDRLVAYMLSKGLLTELSEALGIAEAAIEEFRKQETKLALEDARRDVAKYTERHKL